MTVHDLIPIPADPTRRYALALHWPGVGYYDWSGGRWGLLTAPALAPLVVEGGIAYARVTYPLFATPLALELHCLDAEGRSVGVEAVETLYPA